MLSWDYILKIKLNKKLKKKKITAFNAIDFSILQRDNFLKPPGKYREREREK